MKNVITIPLTSDKKRNLIISADSLHGLVDQIDGKCCISMVINGQALHDHSELTATELYDEICLPSK